MTRRRSRVAADIDPRTEEMSEDALACRSDGHWWRKLPPRKRGRVEARDLADRGLLERLGICARCNAERTQLIDRETRETVSSVMRYPENYLLKGVNTGRLLRRDARWAYDNIF